MNLFDLYVRIAAKDEVSPQLPKISAATVAAGHLMADAAKSAGKAIVNLGKQAIGGFADYEQLLGGVETLYGQNYKSAEEYAEKTGASLAFAQNVFKDYSDRQQTVLENAKNAYITAGMSANEYMNTVNGFAASLTSSLGQYEWQAANYADMIVSDMADNANKMGTDITMIQNAYSGFSKQNFTMLDNLKLGYGGTKKEMERLLRKAEELEGLEIGALDISNFADIADAIHIVQEEMGITGTTAKEASGTIGGSVASMKAAWQNLVVGFADGNADIGILFSNLLDSVRTVGTNVIPVVKTFLTNISQTFMDNAPEMLANGTIMLGKFALGIVEAIPDVVSKIPELITAIVEEFKENGPEIIQIGKDVILGIWNGIQSLVGWLNEKIGNFVGGIVDNVKGVLGIHSPSRVFAGIGENMAMGLGAGWESEYGSIKNNITSGLDFGTARVGLASSGVGQISNGIASGIINSSSAERNIVINLTTTLDGEVLSRKMYDYNEREQLRRGNAFA